MFPQETLYTYFLSMLTKVFSFELSSGVFSTAAVGTESEVSVDEEAVEAAEEAGGEGLFAEDPAEDEAMTVILISLPDGRT